MVHSIPESKEQHLPIAHARREEIAAHLFSLVMFGVCAGILLVTVLWDR